MPLGGWGSAACSWHGWQAASPLCGLPLQKKGYVWEASWGCVWVIPTMTFQNSLARFYVSLIVSGEGRHTTHLPKDIISDISSDILSDISADILSDTSSDTLSDILSGISPDILSDILSDISPDILSDISSDILSDIISRG